MKVLTEGIAHVSFPGGGIFLPARSPYDRQLLAEHVVHRVRAKGQVQVLVDDRRWMVCLNRSASTAGCMGCGGGLQSACYSSAGGDLAYCVRCAFGSEVTADPLPRNLERSVG